MATSSAIKRHGGKGYLAKKFVELFPPHTRYCEPFFGSGAVLFARDGEGVAEFVNDLDIELTNFWRVLQREAFFNKFQRIIEAMPLSETEFTNARVKLEELSSMFADSRIPNGVEQVKRAVWFFVINRQSRQGLGRDFATPTSRLRRGMNEQVSAWLSAVDGLPEFHARLRRVEIRNMPAIDFIRELDSPDTFFYCDPPYLPETRHNGGGEYGEHEMTPEQHKELLYCLAGLRGKFMLSGYPSELYDRYARESGWRHVDFEIDNKASSKREKDKKIERVWMNY